MMETVVQCDFDGTITEDDASFYLLDAHAHGDWRRLLEEYRQRTISVWDLNTRAFSMVRAAKPELLKTLKDKVRVRSGFRQFVDFCIMKGLRFAVVSNGLDFYIEATMSSLGLHNIEVHAAHTIFSPEGLKLQYTGPDGGQLKDDFKEAYTRSFLRQGYRVVYMGNGDSDVAAARSAHHVFATGQLLAHFRENDLDCRPLDSFCDAVRDLDDMLKIQV